MEAHLFYFYSKVILHFCINRNKRGKEGKKSLFGSEMGKEAGNQRVALSEVVEFVCNNQGTV